MRYVDNVYAHDLGLTDEEIAFLLPAAEKAFQAFADKTGYNRSNPYKSRDPFSDHINGVKPPKATELDVIQGSTLYSLLNLPSSRHVSGDSMIKTVLGDTGLGIQHSSYGAVSVTNPSGATAYLVGANSISQYSKAITFNFAVADVSDGHEDRPRLHAGVGRKMELALSAEQFIMMVRGDAGFYTPCGLQINDGHWNDTPPAMTFEAHGKDYFEKLVSELLVDVETEISTLRDLVSKGASKKAEYAALIEQSKRVSQAYAKVIDQVLALGNEKGAAEGQRAQRQFISEMTVRLGQLKIAQTAQELLGLTHD